MFTGIIRHLGQVKEVRTEQNAVRLFITLPKKCVVRNGDSVSVNGVCLTVDEKSRGIVRFTLMPSTLRVTALGELERGQQVNIELPLRYGDRVDGHYVMGHVDGVGRVMAIKKKGESREVTFRIPKALTRYIAPKGSVAIDGVSLTVVSKRGHSFVVSLTPYTLRETHFGTTRAGDKINVEIDMLARYGRV